MRDPIIRVWVAPNDVAIGTFVRQSRGAVAHWRVTRFVDGTGTASVDIPVPRAYDPEKLRGAVRAWLVNQGAIPSKENR